MILYFTETETGAKRWLSVFWNDGFKPRDGGFDFKNDGYPGEFFTLTTSHNSKTRNPVFKSARRIRSPDAPTIRSNGFVVAENWECRACSECHQLISAFAVFLPPGHRRFQDDAWKPHNEWATLDRITCLNDNVIYSVLQETREKQLTFEDGYYWLTRCDDCGALQKDWADHDEPHGAFYP
jgi:hypothetical protein